MRIFKRDERSCAALLCLALLVLSANLWGDCAAGLAAVSSKDYATALKEFTASAGQGDSCSQFNLGLIYHDGEGVPQDYKEAFKWYRLAADQGDAEAQFNLGVLYKQGLGLPEDGKEAAKWWQLAANQGDADAQYNLGFVYEYGDGVAQDYVQAYLWYSLVITSDSKNTDATKGRDAVSRKMTPAQLAVAQTLVQNWKPKPTPETSLK